MEDMEACGLFALQRRALRGVPALDGEFKEIEQPLPSTKQALREAAQPAPPPQEVPPETPALQADVGGVTGVSPQPNATVEPTESEGLALGTSRSSHPSPPQCHWLVDRRNDICRGSVQWAAAWGKYDPNASSWFEEMQIIAGIGFFEATLEDFQRMYFCSPPGGIACGSPPCSCSNPPCTTCFGGLPGGQPPRRAGCTDDDTSIRCSPPAAPLGYGGESWPDIVFDLGDADEAHLFTLGDWGGLDGTLNPVESRPEMVAYGWGSQDGPSAFPRTRWNRQHTEKLCNFSTMVACYENHGEAPCKPDCGYIDEIDGNPQRLVATAFQHRAAMKKPAAVLNVGDNFYWGGIEKTCGTTPMGELSFTAYHQFTQVFENMYGGEGLDGVPWLSVLGNHDWGGRRFDNGWDQQISYTWASDRWIMPAPFWMVKLRFKGKRFDVDVFMMDSNFNDAKAPDEDVEHNLCSIKHNPEGASCGTIGGPASIEDCPGFFRRLWEEQKVWLEEKLLRSKATWQILVTHFPCGVDGEGGKWYRTLHRQRGLDLLVTGHRHDQELWTPFMRKNNMGGLSCIVTGGGGGISSEATPDPKHKKDWYGEAQYGFFDLTIRSSSAKIESVNYDGRVVKTARIYPWRGLLPRLP